MKKLLFLLLFPLSLFAQVPAAQDTVISGTSTLVTPQFRYQNTAYGRLTYQYNPTLAKYDLLVTSKYLRAYYAPIGSGVTSVIGTTNRITVSPTTGTAVVDISATYVGQSSITTLGTVGTGVWNAGIVSAPSVNINGTSGAGYISMSANASALVPTPTVISIFGNGTAALGLKNSSGFTALIGTGLYSGNRNFNLPDASGTAVLNDNTATLTNKSIDGLTNTLTNITATTNANLTGPITSVGNATSIASQTGTGTKFVVDTSPTLVTPILGVASATSLNITGTINSAATPTSGSVTIGFGTAINNAFGFKGSNNFSVSFLASGLTANRTFAIPDGLIGGVTLATIDGGQTFTSAIWNGTKIGLAYGGTNADLSATGGTGQYLKQASTGAAITVGTIPTSDLTGVLPSANGGTGVNNGSSTITLGGNLTTSGAFGTTITSTATTAVTLPTSGTLYGTATGSITSAQLATSVTNETGSGNVVFSASPGLTGTPTIGTGSGTPALQINGGATSSAGGYLAFRRNSIDKNYIGSDAALFANNTDDLALAGVANINIRAGSGFPTRVAINGTSGLVQFAAYGAGVGQLDASGNFTASTTLVNGTQATTQSPGDNTTKVATTAYVDLAFPIDNILSKTADYTILAGDFAAGKKTTLDLYVDATAGNVTITLPSAVTFAGYTIYVTRTDAIIANTITINTVTGGNTLTAIDNSRQFNSNGTVWRNH